MSMSGLMHEQERKMDFASDMGRPRNLRPFTLTISSPTRRRPSLKNKTKVVKVSPDIIYYCDCVLLMLFLFMYMSFDLLIVILKIVTVSEIKTKVVKASPEIICYCNSFLNILRSFCRFIVVFLV